MYSDIVEYNHHLSAAYNNKECKEVVVAAEEVYATMKVEQEGERIDVAAALRTLLHDFNAMIDYRTLRDNLPRCLATLCRCRCVLLYLRVENTLQLVSGSFDDVPGWSSALLAVAHVNPIDIQSDESEACAWREQRVVQQPVIGPVTYLAVPLIHRRRSVGVLVLLRGHEKTDDALEYPSYWTADAEADVISVACVVALLLEDTRLLEHDRERIYELSLLNSISSQMNRSVFDIERLRSVVLQRTREISKANICEVLETSTHLGDGSWITPRLRTLLFQRFREQRSLQPIIIERPGDGKQTYMNDCVEELPTHTNTFFAFPLLSSQSLTPLTTGSSVLRNVDDSSAERETPLFGCIVGGYDHPWKMRQSEIALLQVVASQASAVLENMHLVDDAMQARNEARQLLHQVLEDQHLHALILESVPSGLIATDQNGCIHTFNRAAAIILGYHPYEVLGQPLQKILDIRAMIASETMTTTVRPTAIWQQEAFLTGMHIGEAQSETMITTDRYGRELVLDVDVRALYDAASTQMGLLTTFTDVTLMHRLEEEKHRLDRLASLGEMAASVAHEVRNPLASIKTSMQMLHDDLLADNVPIATPEQDESQREWMQSSVSVVLKEVKRLDTIVRDLLLFASPRQLHRTRCDIVELCEQVFTLVQQHCTDANVEVHRIFDEFPPLWIDTGQIEQVLLNLYLNAIQAMPDGGVLTLACHYISTEQALYDTAGSDCPPTQKPSGSSGTAVSAYSWLIDQHVTQKEFRVDRWLEIIIRDTGAGIAADQLPHIFQPFYTTKAHGIGLGLAITRRLVEDHGGYLRIESQLGYGATVAVRMPFFAETLAQEDSGDH
jgi:PAS domain S-box-containing protein